MTNDLHERPFGLLEDVFVEPDHRGGKIGTTLVKRVIAEAKRRRCYKLIATSRHARDRPGDRLIVAGLWSAHSSQYWHELHCSA